LPTVTRRSQSIKDQRREEAMTALLSALQAALADGVSYNELSVGKLSKLAGISRSTFYAHFRDKAAFIEAWLAQVAGDVERAALAWWAIDASSTIVDLRAALGNLIAVWRPLLPMMSAVFDAAAWDDELRESVAGLVEHYIEALTEHIERGQAEGWIDPDLLPRQTASWLCLMAERAQRQVFRGRTTKRDVEAHLDVFTEIVWLTLYASAPSRA
jgi:TetR/AcrR family transcriptional regulator, ethionamide resistance regulator